MSPSISVQEDILGFTTGLSFREYLKTLDPSSRSLMSRRLDAVRLKADDQLYLSTYPRWLYLILLVSDETPDTFMVTPIVQRLCESASRIEMRIVPDNAPLGLLDAILDEQIILEEDLPDMDLPVLFIFNDEWNQIGQWGPRPQAAEERLDAWLAANPEYEKLLSEDLDDSPELDRLFDELTSLMRFWYNDDLTGACVSEIRAILQSFAETNDS